MILDSGLDTCCSTPINAGNLTAAAFMLMFTYAAIGTGSTPATPEDLLLESQIGSRSNSNGGFSEVHDGALDNANNLLFVEQEFTRVFDITSNVTVREWGLSRQSTGNLTARDLFRDLSNNPTAIPLEDGDQLQIVIKLRVQAAWEYEPASFVITGAPGHDSAGAHDGTAAVTPGSDTTADHIYRTLLACWPGGGTGNARSQLSAILTAQPGLAKDDDIAGSISSVNEVGAAYVPGTFYRDWSATFGTSEANGEHHGWVVGVGFGASQRRGLRFLLTNPATLTKTDSHRLVLTVRKHIARV